MPTQAAVVQPRWRVGATVRRSVALATVLASLAACTAVDDRGDPRQRSAGHEETGPAPSRTVAAPPGTPAPPQKPMHVVAVIADDATWNLMRFLPRVRQMQRDGVTLRRFFVPNALCCPSRITWLTGLYPHNHGILTNELPRGGGRRFAATGQDGDTLATDLYEAGWLTGKVGKTLNDSPRAHVWAGYTHFLGTREGYQGYDYEMIRGGESRPKRIVHFGDRPQDFINRVLTRQAVRFLRTAAASGKSSYVEVTPPTPHTPYAVDPRDEGRFAEVTKPRSPDFGRSATGAPWFMRAYQGDTAAERAQLDEIYRRRARAVSSVNRMLVQIFGELQATGLSGRTVVIFTSDNGAAEGEHGRYGKRTAYDHDIRVPFVAVGPGFPAGLEVKELAQSVDVRATIRHLAGLPVRKDLDGRSLLPLLRGKEPADPRSAAFVEYFGPKPSQLDEVAEPFEGLLRRDHRTAGYTALRTEAFLWVKYRGSGARELYLLGPDPYQMRNRAGDIPAELRRRLDELTDRYARCAGEGCAEADQAVARLLQEEAERAATGRRDRLGTVARHEGRLDRAPRAARPVTGGGSTGDEGRLGG